MKKAFTVVSIVALAALTACGGGGGSDDSTPVTVAKAEGAYSGTLTGTSASAFSLIVLENDEFWSLYGNTSGGSLFVSGFAQGQGASNNGTYTTSNALDFFAYPPIAATISATYDPTSSIAGTISEAGQSATFKGTPIPIASYNYNTPAALTDVAGTWTLTSLGTGSSTPVIISSTGAFTATNLGCTITGSVVPRTSGKNVFNVTIRTGASPCALPNQTGGGIALVSNVGTNLHQLIVLGTYSRVAGFALFGTR